MPFTLPENLYLLNTKQLSEFCKKNDIVIISKDGHDEITEEMELFDTILDTYAIQVKEEDKQSIHRTIKNMKSKKKLKLLGITQYHLKNPTNEYKKFLIKVIDNEELLNRLLDSKSKVSQALNLMLHYPNTVFTSEDSRVIRDWFWPKITDAPRHFRFAKRILKFDDENISAKDVKNGYYKILKPFELSPRFFFDNVVRIQKNKKSLEFNNEVIDNIKQRVTEI